MSVASSQDVERSAGSLGDAAHRLLAPLNQLKRRLISQLLLSEAARFTLRVTLVALLVMVVDATLRWRLLAPRWIGTSAVALAFGGGLALLIYRRSWRFPLSALAARLEDLFPDLRGKIGCAIALAEASEGDGLAGSPSLRHTLIVRASSALAKVNLSQLPSAGDLRLQLIAGVCCCIAIAAWSIAAPQTVWRSARRLAAPWRVDAWPRQVVLEIDAPQKIARGGNAEIAVRTKTPHLPATTTLFWIADGADQVLSQPMRLAEGRFVASIPKMTDSIWIRAEGGDDDQMPWHRIKVVEPISLVASRLEAFPPPYTRAPSFRVTSDAILLEGTRLEVEFRASRPLREAKASLSTKRPAALALDSSGRRATGELTVEPTDQAVQTLRINVRDREGAIVNNAYRGTVKVTRDRPPQIEWRQSGIGSKVQPSTRLPLSARVVDDIRVTSAALRRRVHRSAAEAPNAETSWLEHASIPISEDVREMDFSDEIDLASLALSPGDSVEWIISAVDAKGQSTDSEIWRCTVVDRDDLRKEEDRRFERILEQLADGARRQSEIARSLQDASQSPEPRDAARIAMLRAARFDEQSLLELFAANPGGIVESWSRWIAQRQSHQLQSEADQQRFEPITNELSAIAYEQLPQILHQLDRALSQSSADERQSDTAMVAENSERLHRRLQEIVNQLTHWRRQSLASETVTELLTAQEELLEQTRQASPDLLGRQNAELSDDESSRLRELSTAQASLAQRLSTLAAPLDSNASWSDQRAAVDEEMRRAASDLSQNQLHQAAKRQDRALQGMRQLTRGEASSQEEPNAANPNAATAGAPPPEPIAAGPTAAQVREVLARQIELREQTALALDALARPGADPRQIRKELDRLATEQNKLAKQVESWQTAIDAAHREKQNAPRP